MKNLIEYDKESILSEEVFIEIFEQEDEILKARMLLSCQERAKELGVKTAFDDLVKAYRKVEKAESRRKYNQVNTLVENFTNFTGKYDNMACGAWIVVLDELTEFFDDGEGEDELSNIEATFVRGNSSGFQMIYLYNPPKNPNAPINQWCKKMEKREDCIHIHTDYRDVPVSWLGQALVDSAEAMKRADEKMYRWVWLGQAVGVDELIYYMFGDRHRQKPDPNRRYDRIYIGGDYGQQNATTFEAFGLDTYRKKFPGLGEYYHSGRETGKQKSPSEYAQDLVEFMNELHEQYDNRVFYIFLDPSAKGLAEEIKRATRAVSLDYQVFLRDAENDVALGISRVQKVLSFDIMSIAPKQEYAVSEFGTYEYDKKSIEKGKEVPVKEDDHCMDAIRYCVMGAWKRLKYWLPKDETEEIDVCDISRKEVEDDEYL